MNRKNDKRKQNIGILLSKAKHSFSRLNQFVQQARNTKKCCGTKQNVRERKGKHVHSSRNIKTQQHSAGTSKQLPKSKTQIALGQLGSTSIHLQTKQTRHSPHKHKETLKVQANKGFTRNTTRGEANTKHSYLMKQHFSSGDVKLIWENLEQKQEVSSLWLLVDSLQHNTPTTHRQSKDMTHTVTTKQSS